MKLLAPNSRTMSPFFRDFDQMFDNFFETPAKSLFNLECDVQESEKSMLLTFDLPGLEEKDINVEVKDSFLTISGQREQEFTDGVKNHYTGRSFGSFQRSFSLPDNLDSEKIEADYTNGVLKVLLPKKEETKTKKIEVQNKKGNLLSQLFKKDESA